MKNSEHLFSERKKKKSPSRVRWIILVFIATVIVSTCFSSLSSFILDDCGSFASLIILLIIILIGILFDIVGVAVTAADEKPLHSMASKKICGAKEAISLVRNADRVSSICNDIVGDICGVISGSASAVIALRILENFSLTWSSIFKIAMSALVAGLTVGGKAIGKGFAIQYSEKIVHFVGKVTAIITRPFISNPRKQRKASR